MSASAAAETKASQLTEPDPSLRKTGSGSSPRKYSHSEVTRSSASTQVKP